MSTPAITPARAPLGRYNSRPVPVRMPLTDIDALKRIAAERQTTVGALVRETVEPLLRPAR